MRRTIATLLVAASPLLMAAPVTATDGRPAGPVAPAITAPAPEAPTPLPVAPPAAPEAVPADPSAALAPVRVAPPAALLAPARPVAAKAVPPKTPVPAAVSDAAYAERLRADLCVARQVFCGLTHDGHYPAG